MKKPILFLLFFIVFVSATAFDYEISYLGINLNISDGTYNVTSKYFTASEGGSPIYTETREATIESGYFGTYVNFTITDKNSTFYIEPEINNTNYTRVKYTPAAQCVYASIWDGETSQSLLNTNHSTYSDYLGGYSSSDYQMVLQNCSSSDQYIWKINQNGSVTCAGDSNTDTTYNSDETFIYENSDVFYYNNTYAYFYANSNSSNYWDGYNTPSDLENLTLVSCHNITGSPDTDFCTDLDTTYTNVSFNTYSIPGNISCSRVNGSASNLCTLTDTDTTYTNSSFNTYSIPGNVSCDRINGTTSDLCTLVDTTGGNSTEQMIAAVNNTALNGSNFVSIPCSSLIFDSGVGSASICDGDDAAGAGSYDLNITADDSGEVVITDSEILIIAGGNDINTTASGNTITINSEVIDTDTYNSTQQMVDAVNNTFGLFNITVNNLTCTDCLSGTQIALLTDADISDTLTASTWDGETSQGDLNVNSSGKWDNIDSYNTTVFYIDSSSNLGILEAPFDGWYIQLTDSFGGDVSGTYDAITVVDSSHLHNWVNITDRWLFLSNFTDDLDYTTKNVNSSGYWDALDDPSDINAGDITDDDTYATTASAETFDENVAFSKNITLQDNQFLVLGTVGKIYSNTTAIIITGLS